MNSLFGRYIPGNSFMHRIDPRIKILFLILYFVLLFISSYLIDLVILTVPVVLVFMIANKRIWSTIKLVKLPFIISIFIFAINVYSIKYAESGTFNEVTNSWEFTNIITKYPDFKVLIWPAKGFAITYETITLSISLFIRVYIMILLTSLLTNTTKPVLLTKGIEGLLYPLKFIGVKVHIFAMIISIALRFIPTLLDEANRIMKAQSSRGVDFKNGKLKEKVVSMTTLIIPIFVSAFNKAEELSNAMETRGYDPYAKRTNYRVLKITWIDFTVLMIIIILLTFVILNKFETVWTLPEWYTLYTWIG